VLRATCIAAIFVSVKGTGCGRRGLSGSHCGGAGDAAAFYNLGIGAPVPRAAGAAIESFCDAIRLNPKHALAYKPWESRTSAAGRTRPTKRASARAHRG